jgi:hypothetical protein
MMLRSIVRRIAHIVLVLAAALGGFAATGRILTALLPFPEVPVVSEKLAHLAAQGDQYDTLFLGSSRIYFQVVPSIFDELTAAAGRPTQSFNAGVAALRPPEDAFVLEQILAHPPQHLRYIFVEAAPLRTRLETLESQRAVYWHDWKRMRALWRSALVQVPSKKSPWRRRWPAIREAFDEFSDHCVLFLRCVTNQGRGSILTDRFVPAEAPRASRADLGKRLDGWIPVGARQTMPPAETQAYEAQALERRTHPARRTFGDKVSQEEMEAIIVQIERAGAIPILVIPPTTAKKNFYPERRRMHSAIVLDFSDPRRFPELFEPSQRLDVTHLNTRGAQIFSRLLAERFLAEVPPR